MQRTNWLYYLPLFAVLAGGCGKTEEPKTIHVGPVDAKVTHVSPTGRNSTAATPDKMVAAFLEAARAGDQHRLAQLMTEKAQEQTGKHNVNFELETYRNASFEVGEFEYLNKEKDSAHVACKWSETDTDGTKFTHDVIFVLRREDDGWRVAGMITKPFPDQPPVAFNYENYRELMEAKASVEQEMQRRMELDEKTAKTAHAEDRLKK